MRGTLPALCGRLRERRPPRRPLVRRRRPQRHPLVRARRPALASRETTIDIGYTRAPPLREALGTQYDPFGFVAHAFGAIDGHAYSNNLEAFQRNYGRGFRVFEIDLVRLADGTALAAHPGLEANYGQQAVQGGDLGRPGRAPLPGPVHGPAQPDLVGCCASTPTPTSSSTPSGRGWRSTGPSCARRRSGACASASSRTSRTGPKLTAFRTAYPLQNYMVALYHTRPRTGTTTRWRSTTPAATGPRP